MTPHTAGASVSRGRNIDRFVITCSGCAAAALDGIIDKRWITEQTRLLSSRERDNRPTSG
jgi:hypothetical protein